MISIRRSQKGARLKILTHNSHYIHAFSIKIMRGEKWKLLFFGEREELIATKA